MTPTRRPLKASPQVYRDAAERVWCGQSEFSCCAITHKAHSSCDRTTDPLWRHRRLYQACLNRGGDCQLLTTFNHEHDYDPEAMTNHRIFALLFCAEWCKGLDLPA